MSGSSSQEFDANARESPISTSSLITPFGGALVNLLVDEARAAEIRATAKDFADLTLDERGLCDLELLAVGAYSPLAGFMGRSDYERVVAQQLLSDGTFWPLPIALPVEPSPTIDPGKTVSLRDVYGNLLAFLHIDDIFQDDKRESHYASGKLEVIRVPPRYDFVPLRRTPAQLREHFDTLGWSKVVAYQPQRPMHRAEELATKRIAAQIGGGLLIQPIVGAPKSGDFRHYSFVRCLKALVEAEYEPASVELNLLPLSMRDPGSRVACLQAIVARNYGCTDILFEHSFAEKAPAEILSNRLNMGIHWCDEGDLPFEVRAEEITETTLHNAYLSKGKPVPEWFTSPAVAAILSEANPPRHKQGLTIWFTGLSGSGKSTVAHALVERLAEYGRQVTLLDGDEIRTHLSKGLGFSKEDRDLNIQRVGYVAGLVARHGGTTLTAVISPYRATREKARELSHGNFVEVFCDTPIAICESRDVKGLYAKARAGEIKGFTGVDDPYEPPLAPEVTINTGKLGVVECTDRIIEKLLELGYIVDRHPNL